LTPIESAYGEIINNYNQLIESAKSLITNLSEIKPINIVEGFIEVKVPGAPVAATDTFVTP
jgi:hypothetical protein